MATLKLSLTHRGNLGKKYGPQGLATIDQAVAAWVAKDAARGFRTLHIAVDDSAALKPFKVAPVEGPVTATKVKTL